MNTNTKNWNTIWTISLKYLSFKEIRNNDKFRHLSLPENWLSEFGIKEPYTNDLTTNINYLLNFILIKLMNLLSNELSILENQSNRLASHIRTFLIGFFNLGKVSILGP